MLTLFGAVMGQARISRTGVPLPEVTAELEAQLASVLQEIETVAPESAGAGPGQSHSKRQKVIRGAVNFSLLFPGGNGRSCATCHSREDGFSLSPSTVEARWQRMQQARRHDPNATDPLFRPIDADDGKEDFTLLLYARALQSAGAATAARSPDRRPDGHPRNGVARGNATQHAPAHGSVSAGSIGGDARSAGAWKR